MDNSRTTFQYLKVFEHQQRWTISHKQFYTSLFYNTDIQTSFEAKELLKTLLFCLNLSIASLLSKYGQFKQTFLCQGSCEYRFSFQPYRTTTIKSSQNRKLSFLGPTSKILWSPQVKLSMFKDLDYIQGKKQEDLIVKLGYFPQKQVLYLSQRTSLIKAGFEHNGQII